MVDDEHVVADTLAAILRNAGFAATPVYRGEHALQLARESTPDAVVCDIMLDGVNGIQIAEKIQEMRPDCKVILISGANEAADLLEQSGRQFEVLAKPFNPVVLIEKLREVLDPSTEAA